LCSLELKGFELPRRDVDGFGPKVLCRDGLLTLNDEDRRRYQNDDDHCDRH
jgi:hypothetical protein